MIELGCGEFRLRIVIISNIPIQWVDQFVSFFVIWKSERNATSHLNFHKISNAIQLLKAHQTSIAKTIHFNVHAQAFRYFRQSMTKMLHSNEYRMYYIVYNIFEVNITPRHPLWLAVYSHDHVQFSFNFKNYQLNLKRIYMQNAGCDKQIGPYFYHMFFGSRGV